MKFMNGVSVYVSECAQNIMKNKYNGDRDKSQQKFLFKLKNADFERV